MPGKLSYNLTPLYILPSQEGNIGFGFQATRTQGAFFGNRRRIERMKIGKGKIRLECGWFKGSPFHLLNLTPELKMLICQDNFQL